jgi:hypothetical protein
MNGNSGSPEAASAAAVAPSPLSSSSTTLARAEARRLRALQARARDETLLLTAVGGVAGFVLARQIVRTFMPASAAALALAGVGGLAAGAFALGLDAARERAHAFDRSTWHPSVLALVQRGAGEAPRRTNSPQA